MKLAQSIAFGALTVALIFGISGSGVSGAQQSDPPGPNGYRGPLPRDEFEKGWIRLFDGETTYGWNERGRSDTPKNWTIADAALQSQKADASIATNAEFGDFEFTGECWLENQGAATISLRAPVSGNATPRNSAQVRFLPAGRTAVKPDTFVVPQGKWQPFAVTLEGGKMTHFPDSQGKKMEANIAPRRGVIALASTGKGTVKFRSLKVRPLGFKSLFNGKDLTGWKPIEGHASVFSVSGEGALNIKNGNGEIQSEGTYSDFVLSLDVYSNGDHLNSGVFFREIPGQFWAGYEDQIRNQWQGEDRTKAVDYGTGGVYNRVPARKVLPSDREWFTMMLVVSGNHIASYVNGYEVADFTDTRPATPDNSARNGVRTAAGCFGLQGHDPTTDLSFRNIRVSELPAAKTRPAALTSAPANLR